MNRSGVFVTAMAGAVILSFTQFPFAATMQTRTNYAAAMERVYVVYKDARAQCDPLTGHGKNMCVAEAKAVEKRAKAAAYAK